MSMAILGGRGFQSAVNSGHECCRRQHRDLITLAKCVHGNFGLVAVGHFKFKATALHPSPPLGWITVRTTCWVPVAAWR